MKASAYKQYGDAAILALVLESLPQIAAEVSAPLAKTDEIVLIGGSDRTTQEINKLVGTLPPAIQALTGVDLTGVAPVFGVNTESTDTDTDSIVDQRLSFNARKSPSPPINVGPIHMH